MPSRSDWDHSVSGNTLRSLLPYSSGRFYESNEYLAGGSRPAFHVLNCRLIQIH